MEPRKFDARLLADIPFELLLDLLALSGLSKVKQNQYVGKNLKDSEKAFGGDSNMCMTSGNDCTQTHSRVQAGDPTALIEETCGQNKKETNEPEKLQGSVSEGSVDDDSRQSENSNRRESSDSFQTQSPLNSVKADSTGAVQSVLKVFALKSLTVLLRSNDLLETLTADVYAGNSPSAEELSQQRLNCMQMLLSSIVFYTVLPSPFKRVVSLTALERAQSVLMRAVPSVSSDRKHVLDSKPSPEGIQFLCLLNVCELCNWCCH